MNFVVLLWKWPESLLASKFHVRTLLSQTSGVCGCGACCCAFWVVPGKVFELDLSDGTTRKQRTEKRDGDGRRRSQLSGPGSKLELWIMNAWLIKRPRGNNNNNNSSQRMRWSSRRQTASGFVMLTARMEWDVHRGSRRRGRAVAEMLMRSSMRLANYFPSTQTMPICSARSKRRNMVDWTETKQKSAKCWTKSEEQKAKRGSEKR